MHLIRRPTSDHIHSQSHTSPYSLHLPYRCIGTCLSQGQIHSPAVHTHYSAAVLPVRTVRYTDYEQVLTGTLPAAEEAVGAGEVAPALAVRAAEEAVGAAEVAPALAVRAAEEAVGAGEVAPAPAEWAQAQAHTVQSARYEQTLTGTLPAEEAVPEGREAQIPPADKSRLLHHGQNRLGRVQVVHHHHHHHHHHHRHHHHRHHSTHTAQSTGYERFLPDTAQVEGEEAEAALEDNSSRT